MPENPRCHRCGHLIQAAVAYYRTAGKSDLLDIAGKVADHICDTLGPEEQGKQFGAPGHPEVEMALVELYRPAEAAVEETFVNRNPVSTLKLGQARGIALLVPALSRIAVALGYADPGGEKHQDCPG